MTTSKIKQRRLEVLEDTVKYYSKDVKRRSYHKARRRCYYSSKNATGCTGVGCAIGRLIPPRLRLELDLIDPSGVRNIFNKLPDNVKELGVDFLTVVQSLHDGNIYWNEEGLTQVGKDQVENIKQIYINS